MSRDAILPDSNSSRTVPAKPNRLVLPSLLAQVPLGLPALTAPVPPAAYPVCLNLLPQLRLPCHSLHLHDDTPGHRYLLQLSKQENTPIGMAKRYEYTLGTVQSTSIPLIRTMADWAIHFRMTSRSVREGAEGQTKVAAHRSSLYNLLLLVRAVRVSRRCTSSSGNRGIGAR